MRNTPEFWLFRKPRLPSWSYITHNPVVSSKLAQFLSRHYPSSDLLITVPVCPLLFLSFFQSSTLFDTFNHFLCVLLIFLFLELNSKINRNFSLRFHRAQRYPGAVKKLRPCFFNTRGINSLHYQYMPCLPVFRVIYILSLSYLHILTKLVCMFFGLPLQPVETVLICLYFIL